MHEFARASVVRGYHEYQHIWNVPVDGRELQCAREPGNPMDTSAVAILDCVGGSAGIINVTVGHVPCLISMVCSIFIRRGGAIVCIVTGPRQYSSDLPQGGLEVPCRYIFRTKDSALGEKARKVLDDIFSVSESSARDATGNNGTPKPVGDNDDTTKAIGMDDGPPKGVGNDDILPKAFGNDDGPSSMMISKDGSFAEVIITDDGEAISQPPRKKARISDIDTEYIIMGEELSDIHVNVAQNLIKVQFPELGGLKSTLLQQKEMPVLECKEKMIQVIHCASRHHWIVATTIGGGGNSVVVYDSAFKNVDRETRKNVYKLFESLPVKNIKIPKVQKQKIVGCLL